MMPIQLSLLGPFRICVHDDAFVDLSMRKAEALLAYLAVEHHQTHSRDSLVGLFWPEVLTDKARLSLRVTLSRMKAAFEEAGVALPIYATKQTVQFVHDGCWSDVAEFTRLLHSGDGHGHRADELCEVCQPEIAHAVSLYRTTFLDGLYLDECPLFDEWLFMQRERFRMQVLAALGKLTAFHLRQGQPGQALTQALRQLEIDPLHEEAHHAVMQSYLNLGRRADALRQYEICRAVLLQELGMEPALAMRHLFEQIQKDGGALAPMPQVATAPTTAHPTQSRLPAYLTPFIGRQDELAQLDAALRSGHSRLLTLVGAGGMGKTRLAVEAAQQQHQRFADGVYFVPFASVRTPDAVVDTLAAAFGITFRADERTPQMQLIDWLRPRSVLLVLDNLEHLLACAPFLLEMLHAAPQVQVLVTSREPLGAQAEDLIRLAGLPVPVSEDLDEVGHSLAARLFVERAYRVDKRFHLHAENAADVARICRLVEGRPLGLELAATHTAHRSCGAIADAIRADLDFLAVELIDVPARHRSLRAVFEQSWQALTASEQGGFARLSLFRNPFSIEAATAVAGTSMPVLTRLYNAHLIERNEDGERFQIHELLRQFAADKLARTLPDPSALQRRHAEYFLTWLSRQTQIELGGRQAMQSVDAIQIMIDDIGQAWQWASSTQDVTLLTRALPVLTKFYRARGMNSANQQALQSALEQLPAGAESLQAQLLVELAAVLERQGQGDSVAPLIDEGIALAERSGNHYALALGKQVLSYVVSSHGSILDSIRIAREALDALPEGQHLGLRADILIYLATQEFEAGNFAASDLVYAEAERIVLQTGNQVQKQRLLFYYGIDHISQDEVFARQSIEQALALCADTSDRTMEARILGALGVLHTWAGNYAEGIDYHTRALAICRANGDISLVSYTLHNLCAHYFNSGDNEQAYHYGKEALDIARQNGLPDCVAFAQIHLSRVLAQLHRYGEAKVALNEAREILIPMEHPVDLVESAAGLAHIEWLMGNLPDALAHVDSVYAHLVPVPIPGMDEPAWTYLHCYQVLAACKDDRAQPLLDAAYRYIQTRAARFDPVARERFLNAVPANREILATLAAQGEP